MPRPEHVTAEFALQGKPLPDPAALGLRITMFVDHDDADKRRWHEDRDPIAPHRLLARMEEWEHKYPVAQGFYNHRYVLGRCVKPRGFDDRLYDAAGQAPVYFENTDFLPTYRASAAITNAIASLATSSTLLAGYESDVLDISATKSIDVWLSGVTMVGTTPTANTRIEHHSVSEIADGTWPDVFDGTTGAETVTNQGVKDGCCKRVVALNVSATTSNVGYPYTKRSLGALYGGFVPAKQVFFTTHNTAVNLNSTGGNHVMTQTGVYVGA